MHRARRAGLVRRVRSEGGLNEGSWCGEGTRWSGVGWSGGWSGCLDGQTCWGREENDSSLAWSGAICRHGSKLGRYRCTTAVVLPPGLGLNTSSAGKTHRLPAQDRGGHPRAVCRSGAGAQAGDGGTQAEIWSLAVPGRGRNSSVKSNKIQSPGPGSDRQQLPAR